MKIICKRTYFCDGGILGVIFVLPLQASQIELAGTAEKASGAATQPEVRQEDDGHVARNNELLANDRSEAPVEEVAATPGGQHF